MAKWRSATHFLECCGGQYRPDLQKDGSSPANLQVWKGAKRSAPPLKLHRHSTMSRIKTTVLTSRLGSGVKHSAPLLRSKSKQQLK
jgi:hypothetical protein